MLTIFIEIFYIFVSAYEKKHFTYPSSFQNTLTGS